MPDRSDAAPPADGRFHDVVAVVMAGGIGTRFWPLSTPDRPKQFLTELTGRSLYAQTAERALRMAPAERLLVMTNARFVDLVREQTPDLPAENVIEEPLRRDTAAAVILASVIVRRRWPNAVMVILPSDQFVVGEEAFLDTMAAAVERARAGGLGTVGITPTYPATGFGYLRLEHKPAALEAVRVEEFVEKPPREKAEQYLASGRYLWNGGMFIWQAGALMDEARRHLPRTCERLEPLAEALGEGFAEQALEAFEPLERISIDFGVMEKAGDVWAVPAIFQWSDVGGWLAAEELIEADEGSNRLRGAVVVDEGTGGAIVVGPPDHPIIVAGLTDCIVVNAPGGTLVCHKGAAEKIKPLVQQILGGQEA